MPDHLDRVLVVTRYGNAELSGDSRERLLAELRALDHAIDLVAALEAGGARPVLLTRDAKALVLLAVKAIGADAGGLHTLPSDLVQLHQALVVDLSQPPGKPSVAGPAESTDDAVSVENHEELDLSTLRTGHRVLVEGRTATVVYPHAGGEAVVVRYDGERGSRVVALRKLQPFPDPT